MKPFMHAQLERFTLRLAELDYLLSREDIMKDMTQFMALSREHAEVSVIASRWQRFQSCQKEISASQKMIEEFQKTLKEGADQEAQEMLEMVQDEWSALHKETEQLELELQRLLLPKDPDDARHAYLEIRAGTGGDESALFAGDLLRMYTRYCERVGWRCELISDSPSELGGYKEVVLRVEGSNVYGTMRFESGGHRVQRVPSTESQGRIHTSACTVAVMPEPDPHASVEINPADLRIDTYRASGAGGQHINKTDSAVRVTHLPTGIVAECQDDRSQHRNKAKAMQVLLARIQEKDRLERSLKEAATRKGLIGSGDRSDRIRTYNFPQGRLTDHRINLTLYKLSQIMEGDLNEVLESLKHARESEQMEALEVGGLSA
jgi:peptide chain release factor 1